MQKRTTMPSVTIVVRVGVNSIGVDVRRSAKLTLKTVSLGLTRGVFEIDYGRKLVYDSVSS